jgi:hypothetical protein
MALAEAQPEQGDPHEIECDDREIESVEAHSAAARRSFCGVAYSNYGGNPCSARVSVYGRGWKDTFEVFKANSRERELSL